MRCQEVGVRPSTGSVGDASDNALAEAFFATLGCELLDRRRFRPGLPPAHRTRSEEDAHERLTTTIYLSGTLWIIKKI